MTVPQFHKNTWRPVRTLCNTRCGAVKRVAQDGQAFKVVQSSTQQILIQQVQLITNQLWKGIEYCAKEQDQVHLEMPKQEKHGNLCDGRVDNDLQQPKYSPD